MSKFITFIKRLFGHEPPLERPVDVGRYLTIMDECTEVVLERFGEERVGEFIMHFLGSDVGRRSRIHRIVLSHGLGGGRIDGVRFLVGDLPDLKWYDVLRSNENGLEPKLSRPQVMPFGYYTTLWDGVVRRQTNRWDGIMLSVQRAWHDVCVRISREIREDSMEWRG